MTKANDKKTETKVEVTPEQPVTPTSVEVAPEVPKEESAVEAKTTKSTKGSKAKPVSEKTLDRLVMETKRGDHGSGRDRMNSLGNRYAEVQQELNRQHRLASK